jgi:hypothetical protein
LLVAALLLVGAVVGGNINASRSATGKPEVAPAEPTQVRTEVATPTEIDESEDLNWRETNIDDSVDLRVGDCFNLKHPSAEIEHFKEVACTKEHDYELFYVGAMRKRSHPTEDAILDYVIDYCDPAFGHYIGKDVDDSELDYDWLVPTEDAWRSGDRTVQCAAYDPNNSLQKGSLRGAHKQALRRTSKTLRGSKIIFDSPVLPAVGSRVHAGLAFCIGRYGLDRRAEDSDARAPRVGERHAPAYPSGVPRPERGLHQRP